MQEKIDEVFAKRVIPADDSVRLLDQIVEEMDIFFNEIMLETWGAGGKKMNVDPYVQNIIMTFVSQGTIEIYKQWVADGKKIPLEEIIALTTKPICSGINSLGLNDKD